MLLLDTMVPYFHDLICSLLIKVVNSRHLSFKSQQSQGVHEEDCFPSSSRKGLQDILIRTETLLCSTLGAEIYFLQVLAGLA